MAVSTQPDEVLGTNFGTDAFPVEWEDGERELFWIHDDLHIPNPVSPLFFDIGGWWLTCDHMFRRFGTPFASDWIAKNVNGYVYTAADPMRPEAARRGHRVREPLRAARPARPGVRRPDRHLPRRRAAHLRGQLHRLVARPPAARRSSATSPTWTASTRRARRCSSSRCCSRTRSTSTTATGRSTGC